MNQDSPVAADSAATTSADRRVAGRIIIRGRNGSPRATAPPSDRRPHRARPAPEPPDAVAAEAAEDEQERRRCRFARIGRFRWSRDRMARSERPIPMQPP